jgi:hypothetical protein
MYIVNAQIVHHTTDHNCVSQDKTIQIPTFILDENIQGIVNEEHAKQIAEEIICPLELELESFTLYVNVVST